MPDKDALRDYGAAVPILGCPYTSNNRSWRQSQSPGESRRWASRARSSATEAP
jgi:hypothetical protein